MIQVPVGFTSSNGPYLTITSPNDHSPIADVQQATAEDIQVLLNGLKASQLEMEKLSSKDRVRILSRVADQISQNAERLALLIALEGGKPLKDARVEVSRAQTTLELCAEECLNENSASLPMNRTAAGQGHESRLTRVPIGVVLAISAFNHPLNLLAHQVGCAIASGCVVVLKPAPSTPLCAKELEQFFREAGLSKNFLWVVNAEIPEIERLARSSEISYVSFIGSGKVGWNLRRIIAPGTRIGLELGGMAPAVVASDADLSLAVPALLKSSFYHAGQVCISTQRIYVHDSVYENFLNQFVAGAKSLVTGDARKLETDVGPLVRISEVERLQNWIETSGGKVLCGNEVQGLGQYLTPTVLIDVPASATIMREEAFGPVVCVNKFFDLKVLVEELRLDPYMFESCIFTKDPKKAATFADRMTSMTVVINNHNAFRVDSMPFGGHGLSGLGMGGVKYMIEEMTRLKQVITKVN